MNRECDSVRALFDFVPNHNDKMTDGPDRILSSPWKAERHNNKTAFTINIMTIIECCVLFNNIFCVEEMICEIRSICK